VVVEDVGLGCCDVSIVGDDFFVVVWVWGCDVCCVGGFVEEDGVVDVF